MHIGLIGGIGVAATVVYYQRLTAAVDRLGGAVICYRPEAQRVALHSPGEARVDDGGDVGGDGDGADVSDGYIDTESNIRTASNEVEKLVVADAVDGRPPVPACVTTTLRLTPVVRS